MGTFAGSKETLETADDNDPAIPSTTVEWPQWMRDFDFKITPLKRLNKDFTPVPVSTSAIVPAEPPDTDKISSGDGWKDLYESLMLAQYTALTAKWLEIWLIDLTLPTKGVDYVPKYNGEGHMSEIPPEEKKELTLESLREEFEAFKKENETAPEPPKAIDKKPSQEMLLMQEMLGEMRSMRDSVAKMRREQSESVKTDNSENSLKMPSNEDILNSARMLLGRGIRK